MARELIVYCDESVQKGPYYSNFYGGLLVSSRDLRPVIDRLEVYREHVGLRGEIKWNAVTPSVCERYCGIVDELFRELNDGTVKVRVMFRQNRHRPVLTTEQRATGYHRLYYQFIKHAFGLEFAGTRGHDTHVRLLLDKMPANAEQVAQFRGFVAALDRQAAFRKARIRFSADRIAEIDSSRHILAQCLDLVLGAMAFRLNDLHLAKPEGGRERGKRTRHKELVYKHINRRIRELHPGFNIGVSTGTPGGVSDRWAHPYRHWSFVPREAERDDRLTKKRKAP